MKKSTLLPLLGLLALTGCAVHPRSAFDSARTSPKPNYALAEHWAALPDKQDPADRMPCPNLHDEQATAAADVFFLYPTTYTGTERSEREWNADVNDAPLNRKTDESSILFQASIFNGAGRVFAPRHWRRRERWWTISSSSPRSGSSMSATRPRPPRLLR